MEWLKEYVLRITSISIIGLLLECIMPSGNIKKYASFGLSLILSISLISPLLNFEVNNISFDFEERYEFDYTESVKSTVNSVKGFEKADVYVEQENNKISTVSIKSNNDKTLEKAVQKAMMDFLKNIINVVYGVEKDNIYIVGLL